MPDAHPGVPPSNLDAEGSVLSALILEPSRLMEVSFLRPEHFYSTSNAHVFRAIRELDSEGKVVDSVTVADYLRERDLMQAVGGTPYLARLLETIPAVANLEAHARIIVREHDRRRIIIECQRIAAETYGNIGDIDDWKNEVDTRIQAVTQSFEPDKHLMLIGEATRDAMQVVWDRKQQKGIVLTGCTTGLPTLDARLGGLEEGKSYVVAARPGMGKTSLATGIVMAIAKGKNYSAKNPDAIGDGVVFVSIEMPRQQIVFRFLSQISRIDSVKIQRGRLTDIEFQELNLAAQKLAKLPIAIEDSSNHTPASLRAAFRQGKRKLEEKHGKKLKVRALAVDYLQLMGTENTSQNRETEISAVARACKNLAKSEGVAVLELAQVNRDCEKRPDKRPLLSDLRESGAIEQDADSVIFIYREDVYRKDGEEKDDKAELLVRKLRDNGGPGTVHCEFHPETTTFFETSKNPDYDQLGDMFDDYLEGTSGEPTGSDDDEPPANWQDRY